MNILLVEGEPLTLKVMEFALTGQGYHIAKALTIQEARKILKSVTPTLVIAARTLPDGSGEAFSRELLRERPEIPVIITTAEGRTAERLEMANSADEFITKPFELKELFFRVKKIMNSERDPGSGVLVRRKLRVGNIELSVRERVLTIPLKQPCKLNTIETRIMECLMLHAGQVVTREHLLAEIADCELLGYIDEIDDHIIRLRRKIEPNPVAPKYLKTVESNGSRGFMLARTSGIDQVA
jgi:DNA-binding response OmpR family regulator